MSTHAVRLVLSTLIGGLFVDFIFLLRETNYFQILALVLSTRLRQLPPYLPSTSLLWPVTRLLDHSMPEIGESDQSPVCQVQRDSYPHVLPHHSPPFSPNESKQ